MVNASHAAIYPYDNENHLHCPCYTVFTEAKILLFLMSLQNHCHNYWQSHYFFATHAYTSFRDTCQIDDQHQCECDKAKRKAMKINPDQKQSLDQDY